jgi:hypothetical protein
MSTVCRAGCALLLVVGLLVGCGTNTPETPSNSSPPTPAAPEGYPVPAVQPTSGSYPAPESQGAPTTLPAGYPSPAAQP